VPRRVSAASSAPERLGEAVASLRLVEPPRESAQVEEAERESDPVRLADPGAVLRGVSELHALVRDEESVAWVEYQVCRSGSFDWQVLTRSQASPFSALLDTATLADGDYDLRVFVGRRDGQVEGSRALRGRAVANRPLTVTLRQPQPGCAGAVALEAQILPTRAALRSLRFEFSRDGKRWRPILRAARTGPASALWYTAGLAAGAYRLRAVATDRSSAEAISQAVSIQLDLLLR
jgi:hypothetical protein